VCKHVLSVPCDSHGIQLIFKDLLFPGKGDDGQQIVTTIGKFFKDFPNKIVSFFSSSDKQLAYLREAMVKCGGIVALITTVPTRWGTQVRQIQSINKSSEALKAYAERPDDDKSKPITIKPLLYKTSDFWQQSRALEVVLEPIHTQQKMSESNRSTLGKVYTRWITLNGHFQEFRKASSGTWWQEINNYCTRVGRGGWNDRCKQQVLPIHLAAYILLPVNHDALLTAELQKEADDWVMEKTGPKGFHQWYQYRKKQGTFGPLNNCWLHFADNASAFWEISVSGAFISSWFSNIV
jgi:hypothetical protein